MRKVTFLITLCFALIYGFAALAQDPLQVAPDHYKLLLDNERVRVLEFHGNAGDKILLHSHPDHVVYMVHGGKAKFTSGGKTVEQDMKTGSVVFTPAETHEVEIVGPGEVHVIVIELKK